MSDFFGEANKTFQPQNIQRNVQKSSKQSIDHYQDEASGFFDFSKNSLEQAMADIDCDSKNSGTTSLVFGILSCVLMIIPFLFPILSICFSKNSDTKMAKAGKILGIIGMIKDGVIFLMILSRFIF